MRWIAEQVASDPKPVMKSLDRARAAGWLDRYDVTEAGREQIPAVLLDDPDTTLDLLAQPWTSESAYGLRGLVVYLTADNMPFTSTDVARWLEISKSSACNLLKRWQATEGLFVYRRPEGWAVAPMGPQAPVAVADRVEERTRQMWREQDERKASRARWTEAQFGPPWLQQQTDRMFEDYFTNTNTRRAAA